MLKWNLAWNESCWLGKAKKQNKILELQVFSLIVKLRKRWLQKSATAVFQERLEIIFFCCSFHQEETFSVKFPHLTLTCYQFGMPNIPEPWSYCDWLRTDMWDHSPLRRQFDFLIESCKKVASLELQVSEEGVYERRIQCIILVYNIIFIPLHAYIEKMRWPCFNQSTWTRRIWPKDNQFIGQLVSIGVLRREKIIPNTPKLWYGPRSFWALKPYMLNKNKI